MKQNNGFGVIIILVTLTILIGISGAVIYKKNKAKIPVAESTPSVNIENTVNVTIPTAPKPVAATETNTNVPVVSNLDWKNNPDYTEHQKQMIQEQVNMFESMQQGMGMAVIPEEKEAYIRNIIDAVLKGSEAGIKTGMQTGVPSTAEIYFSSESLPINSYGSSATQNFCTSTSMQTLIANINQFTKIKAVCKISNVFPAKSYTIIVPSVINKGQYYCTDPKNFGISIQLNSGYKAGEKCR